MIPEVKYFPVQLCKLGVSLDHFADVAWLIRGDEQQPCIQFPTYILMVFPKNVKRDQQVFLQHVQLQTGIKSLPRVMKILLRAPVKFSSAFLNQHNGIDPLDIVIRKPLPGPALLLPHLGILPHEQVAGITGAAGAGKQVAHSLNLHVH